MLTGCNPNPEGPSEVCDLAPRAGGRQAVGVVGRLHGWTALGFSLHLLTAGPWPGLQSLGFFIWEGPVFYREMRSQVCVIKNPRTHTQQVPQVLATVGLTCYHCFHSTCPPTLCTHCPASRRCFQLFNQGLERSPDLQQHCFCAASPPRLGFPMQLPDLC